MSEKMVIKSVFGPYEVHFIEDFAQAFRQELTEPCYVLLDEKIESLHPEKVLAVREGGHQVFPIEATEANKSLDFCQSLIKELIGKNIRKNSRVVAIGGGIIQDIAGFVSSIVYRGLSWTFFPTTLLAQADSCIGSKTSINLGSYKNLLGGFYPPSRIFIDPSFLLTLPVGEIKSGIGEILHFYLIDDSDLTAGLMADFQAILEQPALISKYIRGSLAIKKAVIEIDEFDRGVRNLFNYGHTFGHAIETITGYAVSHGQAVTLGMDLANWVSLNRGMLSREDFDRMHDILARNKPDYKMSPDKIEEYIQALSRDKKNVGGNLGCILTRKPGAMEKLQIPLDDELKKTILSYFEQWA